MKLNLYENKKELVVKALNQTRTVTEAGQRLNVADSTIRRWIKQLNIKKQWKIVT